MLPMVQAEPVLFSGGNHPIDGAATPTATLPPSLTPDSEVDELVDIFFDVNTFSRIESCELQLGDTWRGTQGKMSVTAPVKKIRKKSDNKPQSQINKCHNEKRRRELENETINQLEELLGKCLAEVKQPDKNGIVREATRQIEEVLKKRRECPVRCPLNAHCLSPVQGGEVSSTQPHAGIHYSELTTLIEALKHYTSSLGWVLLEINSRGEIECVTENIKDIVLQDRTELYNKSIFSILHVNDHSKLRPLLRTTQSYGGTSADTVKFQSIQARFAVNDSNGDDFTSYVECVIHCAGVRGPSAEEAGSVMCVIRRLHDASAALLPIDTHQPAATRPNEIVFRLDSNFTILSCDLSGVENSSNYQVSLVGRRYLELVESADRWHVSAHLSRASSLPAPPAVSRPFRLRVLPPPRAPLAVQARSRLFRAKPTSDEPDFIMSTHALLADDEGDLLEAASPRPAPATPQPPAPPGGPLMTSVADEAPPPERRFRSPADAASEPQYAIDDFDLNPWAATFQQLADMPEAPKDEGAGEGPSAPRAATPPPAPPPDQPNRLRSLLSMKPHGPGDQVGASNNRILKDLLKQEDEEASAGELSAPHTPHAPRTPASALSPLHNAHQRLPHPQLSQQHNDAYLIKMLNDKTEEESEERRNDSRGAQPSALLCQLLSSNGPSNGRHDAADGYLERIAGKRKMDGDKGTAGKRATPDNQHVSSSAVATASTSTTTSPASSSPGMSPLCQKNQILVSLLARQQTTPTTPLPLPNPSLRAYGPGGPRQRPPPPPPQQQQPRHMASTLTNILNANNRANAVNGGPGVAAASGGDGAGLVASHLQMVLQGGSRGSYPQPMHYPAHNIYNNQSGNRPPQQSGNSAGDSEVPNDKTLSDLLDEVIDHMPDSDRPAPEAHALLDFEASRQTRPDFAVMKEKNEMINAIRQSLMQCETVTKSPVSSPNAPPGYPGQSVQGASSMSGGSGYLSSRPAGARGDAALLSLAEQQQRARLLQMQQTQQMLVSPQAAEQPQADLGSTINTLAPPNVSLTRTGYHHQQLYHAGNQMTSSYGTNKITSSQQNPMLSRQLSGGYAHSPPQPAAAPHTPRAPPFLRAPRPHLVSGYYEEGGAYCGEYPRRPLPPPHARDLHMPGAGNGGGMGHSGAGAGAAGGTSEYVRNELRAVVGARSARPDLHQQPADMDPLMAFDMPTPGGGNAGARGATPGSWDAQQGSPSTTEAGSAEAAAGGDEARARAAGDAGKASSLLQKLLSQ